MARIDLRLEPIQQRARQSEHRNSKRIEEKRMVESAFPEHKSGLVTLVQRIRGQNVQSNAHKPMRQIPLTTAVGRISTEPASFTATVFCSPTGTGRRPIPVPAAWRGSCIRSGARWRHEADRRGLRACIGQSRDVRAADVVLEPCSIRCQSCHVALDLGGNVEHNRVKFVANRWREWSRLCFCRPVSHGLRDGKLGIKSGHQCKCNANGSRRCQRPGSNGD